MASPSARVSSALSAILPDHLSWLCSSDFIQPCIALHGPAYLIDTLQQHSSSQFNVLQGDYDCRLPERSIGSDDEDDETDVQRDSQPAATGIIYATWFTNRIGVVPVLSALLFQWTSEDSFADVRKFVGEQVRTHRQHNRTRAVSPMVVIFKASAPLEDDVLLERQVLTLRDDLALADDFVIVSASSRPSNSIDAIVSQIKENAIASYSSCTKVLKKKRSKLGRHSSIFTLIRYHIKLGFYAFLTHDLNSAKKYFTAAHKDLLDLRPSTTFELMEVRDVGVIVNALMCRLLILSEDVSGAIEQFGRHIRAMARIGVDDAFSKSLRFTLHSWLQQEYTIMGLLMKSNLAQCLRYVNSAANSLARRMECAFALPDFEQHYVEQLHDLLHRTPFYWGQVPRYDEFEPDNSLAHDIVLLSESLYRQSTNVTALLSAAHNLLLAYPRKRKRHVALSELRIARKLNRDGSYATALPLFHKAVNLFRQEGWVEMLIAALRDVRLAYMSLGLLTESILCICELIAFSAHGSTAALQNELFFNLRGSRDVIAISSPDFVTISQDGSRFSIKGNFSPVLACDLITVHDASGASWDILRNAMVSRAELLTPHMELPAQSYAVLILHGAALRVPISHSTVQRSQKGAVRVTARADPGVLFAQERFPLALTLENSAAYSFYTISCNADNAVADETSGDPVSFINPVAIPSPRPGAARVINAQLRCASSGTVQMSLKLFAERLPCFEHQVQWRIINPFLVVHAFFSVSFSNPGASIPGNCLLRLGSAMVFHVELQNPSSTCVHVSDVFFDHCDAFQLKQKPGHAVGQDLQPGSSISLQFAFVPVKQCDRLCPGRIRCDWRRSGSSRMQTFVAPVSTSVTVFTPAISADIVVPAADQIQLWTCCRLVAHVQSYLNRTSRVDICVESQRSVYHVSGPIKKSIWVGAGDTLTLEWRLYPLQTGFQPLPLVRITSESGDNLLPDHPFATVFVNTSPIHAPVSSHP